MGSTGERIRRRCFAETDGDQCTLPTGHDGPHWPAPACPPACNCPPGTHTLADRLEAASACAAERRAEPEPRSVGVFERTKADVQRLRITVTNLEREVGARSRALAQAADTIARLEDELNARDLVIARLRLDLEAAHLARIAAQNPGIDIDSVRRRRRKEVFLASLPEPLDVDLNEDPPDRGVMRVVGRFIGPDGPGIVSEPTDPTEAGQVWGPRLWGVVDA